jgi:3-isopropylmalate/(R)-2-methylmalate dehydratase large subunit
LQQARTLYDKLWDSHVVHAREDGANILYVDRHVLHEVTSAQPFDGLRRRGLPVARPDRLLAMPDHNVTTGDRSIRSADDEEGERQLAALERNARDFNLNYIPLNDPRQGIVHVVAPEQGFTLPGTTLVCGDSHTSTHGAFGALAFAVGTSEVEHVLATQTVVRHKSRNLLVRILGRPGPQATAKDVVLAIIGRLGTTVGTGHVIEFAGEAIQRMSMEERMTVCNMAIEAGARSGLIAPDETTFAYLRGRPLAPEAAEFDSAVRHWKTLVSDPGAHDANTLEVDIEGLAPQVTWGTSPQDVCAIGEAVPEPDSFADASRREAARRALKYMGLRPGTRLDTVPVDRVFIGSCTNSRIEDLRSAAAVARGRKVAPGVRALVVPGSGLVKRQAEQEGLDLIFLAAGFEWREPGCSMCIGMNGDLASAGQRCASTSNRNFESRQGRNARTHLMSPAMAAAAAVTGRLADVRELIA